MGIKVDSIMALNEPSGDPFIDELASRVNRGEISIEQMRAMMKDRAKEVGL